MNLQEFKTLLFVATAVLALFVASPALQRFLVYPPGDFVTEMGLLGPEHTVDNYPFNITLNANYQVFLEASNHLGRCAYYEVRVKFRTQNQSAPDSFTRTSSSLPSLCNVHFIVADEEDWELPVTFSFDYLYDQNNSQVNFNRLMFNDVALNLNGYSATWDSETSRFFGNLIFELWIYSDNVGDFTYHERYSDLKFNMTVL